MCQPIHIVLRNLSTGRIQEGVVFHLAFFTTGLHPDAAADNGDRIVDPVEQPGTARRELPRSLPLPLMP